MPPAPTQNKEEEDFFASHVSTKVQITCLILVSFLNTLVDCELYGED